MNALSTALVWVCAAIVALPLSPCAFFTSCCDDPDQAPPEAVAAERPCCAQHEAPQPSDHEHDQEQPCSRACCHLSPFVTVEKVLTDAPAGALLAVLPPVADVQVQLLAFAPVETPQPVPLQILHCQWRR